MKMSTATPPSSSIAHSSPRTQSTFHLPQQLCSQSHPALNLRCRRRLTTLRCSSSGGSGGPGENESRTILDAFFLGKAIGEAVSERIESTVGEFLSTVGRLQAEQQKQVQEFQEEVLDRAKRAKEKAAREAMEAQGLVPKPSSPNTAVNGVGFATTSPDANSVYPNSDAKSFNIEQDSSDRDPLFGISDED